MTQQALEPELQKRETTRIARFVLPSLSENSPLLPSDRWIVKNAFDVMRNNKAFRGSLVRLVVAPVLGTAAVVAGIVTAVAAFPAVPMMALSTVASAGLGIVFSKMTRDAAAVMRDQAVPEIQGEMAVRYFQLKTRSVAQAWSLRLAQKRAQTAAAATADTEKKNAKPGVAAQPVEMGKSLRKWAFRKAVDKAVDGAVKIAKNDNKPATPQAEEKTQKPATPDKKTPIWARLRKK